VKTLIIFLLLHTLAWSGDVSPEDWVLTVNSGISHSNNDGYAAGIDLEGTLLIYNVSVESYYKNTSENPLFTTRMYLGVGMGPLIQLQGGFGVGEPSLRLRSNINLLGVFTDDFSLERLVQYREKEYQRWAPLVTFYCDKSKDDFRIGILLGFLL
jgi:hypothetical protein